MSCECKVGPGKFEGESALTFLAWQSVLLGGSDATTGLDDSPVDWFRSPFGFDADQETVKAAREYGYCEPCIADALADPAYGLAVWEDGQGFVGCRSYDTREDFDKALSEAEDEDSESEE